MACAKKSVKKVVKKAVKKTAKKELVVGLSSKSLPDKIISPLA